MSALASDPAAPAPGAPLAVVGFSEREVAAGASLGCQVPLADAAAGDAQVLAFYRAPWEAFLEARSPGSASEAGEWLAQWCRFHRDVLALYRAGPERVMLVNAGRLREPSQLHDHLRSIGIDVAPGAGMAAAARAPAPALLHRLLAAGLADAGDEAWALYEELESCALLLGREPEFQAAVALPDLAEPGDLLAGFAELRDGIAASLDAMRTELSVPEAAASPSPLEEALRQENELLSLQLQQVLEELHYQVESGTTLRTLLLASGETAEAARLLISKLSNQGPAPA